MERQSISLIGFSVFFGVLVGFALVLSALYANGAFNDKNLSEQPAPSGMELLNAYVCQKAETKQIILGGIEDNFDRAGIETSNPSEKTVRYIQGQFRSKTKSEIVKTYDDPKQDRLFSDRFTLPKRTFHGIVAVRLEEVSSLKNDGISLGYNPDEDKPYINRAFGYSERISNLATSKAWKHHDTLYFANLSDLKITSASDQKQTLLDIIRTQRAEYGDFFVDITDDTVIDFVGFALCLEPNDNNGTVYSLHEPASPNVIPNMGDGIVGLFIARIENKICDYGGCLSCDIARPVACIHDTNMPVPDGYKLSYLNLWSGGEFKFTKAVKGSKFATEDDVNEFCAIEFGPEWRALSRHDGHWGGSLSGKGAFPAEYENVWINVKDSDHHNCWTTRPDYRVLDDG